jgi:uncharacterized membrane protein YedE/YeeE
MQASILTGQTVMIGGRRVPRQSIIGTVVLLVTIGLTFPMAEADRLLGPLWLLGVAAGFTVQRSRFCFASAFRDVFLFGNSRIMRGILAGLAVASVGFSLIQFNLVPFPQFGALPAEAHILPVGLSTVIAGLLFGCGMVIAGGCVSGSLYRTAEGYVASAVAVLGIVVGLGALLLTWNWWWDGLLSNERLVWFPAKLSLGYGGALAVTLAGILAAYLALLWWESRNGLTLPPSTKTINRDASFQGQLKSMWRRVFVEGWSPVAGGVILGVLGTFMYLVHMPWGVTGELASWAENGLAALSLDPGELRGLSDIGGCASRAEEGGIFTHPFAMTVGLIAGSGIGALFAGEFKLRFPRQRRRYLQAAGGGLAMGYGAGLGIGCTVGAFFSAIPSFSLSGWLFALSLFGGAYLGVFVVRRIP